MEKGEIIDFNKILEIKTSSDELGFLDSKIGFWYQTILYLDETHISIENLKHKILFVFDNILGELENILFSMEQVNITEINYLYGKTFSILMNYISSIYFSYSDIDQKEIINVLKNKFFKTEQLNNCYDFIICMSDISDFLVDLMISKSLEPEVDAASQEYFITQASSLGNSYFDKIREHGEDKTFYNLYCISNPENYSLFDEKLRISYYIESGEYMDLLVEFLLKYDFSDITNIFEFKKNISKYDIFIQNKLIEKFKNLNYE